MAKPRLNVAFLTGDTTLNVTLARALAPPVEPGPQRRVAPPEAYDPEDYFQAFFGGVSPTYHEFETQTRRYTAVEHGNFEKPRRHLLNGAGCFDGAVLTVFASEGLGVITREHILLLREAGIHRVAIVVDTSNLVGEPEVIDLTEADVRAMLAEYGFPADDLPAVRGNLIAAGRAEEEGATRCLDELRSVLDTLIPPPSRDEDGPFLLSIDEVDSGENGTTVVSGWAERGRVEVRDELEVVGRGSGLLPVRVLGLHRSASAKRIGRAGSRFSVRLGRGLRGGVQTDNPEPSSRTTFRPGMQLSVQPGQVLAARGSVQVYCRFDADCYLATRREGGCDDSLGDGEQVQFLLRTRESPGVVRQLGEEQQVWPGRRFRMRAELPADCATVMAPGLRFAFRGEEGLSGYGVVEQVYR